MTGDSGNVKIHAFCSVCGTPVYMRFKAMPDFIAIAVGSLGEPARFVPQVLTYSACALSWDAVLSLKAFERMPAN